MIMYDNFKYLTSKSEEFLKLLINSEIPLPLSANKSNFNIIKELESNKYILSKINIKQKNPLIFNFDMSIIVIKITEEGMRYFEMKDLHERNKTVHNTIEIHGNVTNSPIQQNSVNSVQNITTSNEFYEEILKVLLEIKKYTSDEIFKNEFGDKTEHVKSLIEETIDMVNTKSEPSKIKKSLTMLKEIAVGVSGSLIASGIVGLLGQLTVF